MKLDLENASKAIDSHKELREKANAANDEDEKVEIMNEENLLLRSTLKQMNTSLTSFIELLKDYKIRKLAKPKYGNENLPTEYKLRSRDAEDVNYQKMIDNMKKEHSKLKGRLDIVGEPSYSIGLRKKVMEKKSEIRALEELRSKLKAAKFQREKKMNKVLMAGQPDSMIEIQNKVQEMTTVFDRLEKVNKKVEFQQSTKAESQKAFEETQNKLKELESSAQSNGIDIDTIKNSEEDVDFDISSDSKTYQRKENILQQAIETDRQMYSKILNDLKKKLINSMQDK